MIALGFSLCVIWLAGSAGSWVRDAQSDARMEGLRQISAGTPVPVSVEPPPSPAPTAIPAPEVLPDLTPLYEQNPDLAGWISIEGTVIDYPVMFRPQDEVYYLGRGFDGNEDRNGSLFIQKDCDPFTPGTNIIIHGHNMKSGRMFGTLDAYTDEAYWREHPVIDFSTLYERGSYEIIAVFISQVYRVDYETFKYYRFTQADTQEEFSAFLGNIKSLSLYDTEVDAQFGDTLITLSTCAYHTENGRLVIVAKKPANVK